MLMLNPNTSGCPVFANAGEAEITKLVYRRFPVLSNERIPSSHGWNPRVAFVFEMNKHSNLFRDTSELRLGSRFHDHECSDSDGCDWVALYEAKQIHQYDHRFATYEFVGAGGVWRDVRTQEHLNPAFIPVPRQYVRTVDFIDSIRRREIVGEWFLTYRDITNATNERSAIFAILPYVPMGNTWTLCLDGREPREKAAFVSCMNSFPADFIARRKIGGSHLNFYVLKQLAAPTPNIFCTSKSFIGQSVRLIDWLVPRVLELTYTAWDLELFAKDCGFEGPPFHWDEERRFLLRSELDAAFFHLYLPFDLARAWQPSDSESEEDLKRLKEIFPTPRHAVDYIMDTFPIVKKKDIEKYGNYRTKLQILEIYDDMQQAMTTGRDYQTKLDPPPADPRCCHPARDAANP